MYARHRRPPSAVHQHGLTLVEMMIALVLGLVVIAAATAVYLSNKQAYITNGALGDVQDSARIAYELLARDIRQAGLTGCGNRGRVANVLNNGPANGGTAWYADFGNAILGFDGSASDPAVTTGAGTAQRVAGTSSIELIGAGNVGATLAPPPQGNNPANFKLDQPTTQLRGGDIIVVCDPDHATIVQITSIQNSNTVLVHNAGNGVATPGNCSKGLGYPTNCSSANGNAYQFLQNAQISRLSATDWYIGNNPQGGRSLYRIALVNTGGIPTSTAQEMVRNVTDMQLTYHMGGQSSYVSATAVGSNWSQVDAVQLQLTLQSTAQHAGTDAKPLSRPLSALITLRNRVL